MLIVCPSELACFEDVPVVPGQMGTNGDTCVNSFPRVSCPQDILQVLAGLF